MRNRVLVPLLMMLIMTIPTSIGAGEGGVDTNPDEDDPFTVVSRDTPSVDKEVWSLSIEMSEEAYNNGTTFEIITQICTNDGICDPPVTMDAEVDERIHSISLTPPNDHTYVNWRVKATDSEGNKTSYPHGDWFKTWSSCYYNEGAWGGADSLSDGCADEGESTPGFSIMAALAALSIAGVIIKRRESYQK